MISLIIPILLIVFAIIMSYCYIRLAIAKEKENELLKQQLKQKEQIEFRFNAHDLAEAINRSRSIKNE